MKIRSIFCAFLMTAIVQIGIFAQSADDFDVEQLANNTLKITKYKGSVTDVVIPANLYGLPVTVIGKGAFSNTTGSIFITSVVIPDTVTIIEERAFFGGEKNVPYEIDDKYYSGMGKLTRVSIGNGVRNIGRYAFSDNHELTELNIPNSVVEIGESAFEHCGLTKLHLGNRLEHIGVNAFKGSGDMGLNGKSIQISGNNLTELILPASLKTIGSNAFSNNQLQSLIIPNGVVLVNSFAFDGNPITTLVIPASLTRNVSPNTADKNSSLITAGIGTCAFRCPINRITLPANASEKMLTNALRETSLINFFKSQNMAAGTYVKNGPIWSKE